MDAAARGRRCMRHRVTAAAIPTEVHRSAYARWVDRAAPLPGFGRRVTLAGVKVGVVGAGYVGLVTAACFAKLENDVVIVEADADRLDGLRRGVLPISEPGLDQL